MKNRASLSILLSILLLGCGRKGDPVAPSASPPDNVRNLKARIACQSVELSFSPPKTRADGAELSGPLLAEIYRRTMPPDSNEPQKQKTPEFEKLAAGPIPEESGHYVDDGKQKPFEPGGAYEYQIVLLDADGEVSAPSNTARIQYALPPAPPAALTGKAGPDGVALSWQAPELDCAGGPLAERPTYQVFRKLAEEKEFPAVPLNPTPLQETTLQDRTPAPDRSYVYTVRATLAHPERASANAQEFAIELPDTFPPAPPSGLVLSRTAVGIQLLWNPSPSTDVLGYRVYRELAGKTLLLTTPPIPQTSFLDKEAQPGRPYRYRVTAVDRSSRANESSSTPLIGAQ